MSQGDYLRAKRTIYEMSFSDIPNTVDAGTYSRFRGYTIANSVRGNTSVWQQLTPANYYSVFDITRPIAGYDTTACPAFALCNQTNLRANRTLTDMSLFTSRLSNGCVDEGYVPIVYSCCPGAVASRIDTDAVIFYTGEYNFSAGILTFLTSGTLMFSGRTTTANLLMVGGGGGGGCGDPTSEADGCGGGGGGEVGTGTITLYEAATYMISIGAGGTGASSDPAGVVQTNSIKGGNTSITNAATFTVFGGGRGAVSNTVFQGAAGTGGSAGGATAYGGYGASVSGTANTVGTLSRNVGIGGQVITTGFGGGGGGGAGGAGGDGSLVSGGTGGDGMLWSYTNQYYAGGGGGGGSGSGALNGVTAGGATVALRGGGGAGVSGDAVVAGGSGIENTGGGGGGGSNLTGAYSIGGTGGSGVVIFAF